MVHGGGTCSGGGSHGGGFSSSSHTYISTTNYHRFDTSEKDCDDCKKCFLCLGLCFGCRGKNHVHKIFKMWAWLVILFFVTGLAVAFGTYGPTDIPASPSDMIPMTRGINPSFCEGVTVETTLPVNTYLLPSSPTVSSSKIPYSITQTAVVVKNKYEYWGFYLLAGSTIEIDVCGDNDGNLYIIKGDDNFNDWKEDNYDPGTYKKTTRTRSCVKPKHDSTKLLYNVVVTAEYYIVLTNHNYKPLSVSITFNLNRTVYVLGHHTEVCNYSRNCHIDLSGDNAAKSIVVYVPESDEFDFTIKTVCLRRNSVFIVIFLVVPLLIGVLVTAYLVYIKYRVNTRNRSVYTRENHALTSFPSAHRYETIENDMRNEPSAPPYSDAMMDDLPSYDQAIKLQYK